MAEKNTTVMTSPKTASLKMDLMALNAKNMQAEKVLNDKYAVKNDVGRKKREQANSYRMTGLAQVGSATSIDLPSGYKRPKNG